MGAFSASAHYIYIGTKIGHYIETRVWDKHVGAYLNALNLLYRLFEGYNNILD